MLVGFGGLVVLVLVEGLHDPQVSTQVFIQLSRLDEG